jgi:hypothetical protein
VLGVVARTALCRATTAARRSSNGRRLLFAAVLAAQATLWLEVGKIDGQLAATGVQEAEIT